MKFRLIPSVLAGAALLLAGNLACPVYAQEGPQSQSGDSVAKPKNKPENAPAPEEDKPIPSEYKKKDAAPKDTTTFRSNADDGECRCGNSGRQGSFHTEDP